MYELKQRVKWDGDEFDDDSAGGGGDASSDEAIQRVTVGDVGRLSAEGLDAAFGPVDNNVEGKRPEDGGDFGLTPRGQQMVADWLEERI